MGTHMHLHIGRYNGQPLLSTPHRKHFLKYVSSTVYMMVIFNWKLIVYYCNKYFIFFFKKCWLINVKHRTIVPLGCTSCKPMMYQPLKPVEPVRKLRTLSIRSLPVSVVLMKAERSTVAFAESGREQAGTPPGLYLYC